MFVINSPSTSLGGHQIPAIFISIEFTDSPYMVQVATQLRRAWLTRPNIPTTPFVPSTSVEHAYVDYIFHETLRSASQYSSNKQWAAATRLDPVPGKTDTFWHEKITYTYNHVFADTWRFLNESMGDVGSFRPPCDKCLAVPYSAQVTKPLEMKFEDNVLVYPAFLATGVRLTWQMEGGLGGVFDESNKEEIWWVKCGKRVEIYVERCGYSRVEEDVVAVLVLGRLGASDLVKDAWSETEDGGNGSRREPRNQQNDREVMTVTSQMQTRDEQMKS